MMKHKIAWGCFTALVLVIGVPIGLFKLNEWWTERKIIRSVEHWVAENGLGDVWETEKMIRFQQYPRKPHGWMFTVKGKVKSLAVLRDAIRKQKMPNWEIYFGFRRERETNNPKLTLTEYIRNEYGDDYEIIDRDMYFFTEVAPYNFLRLSIYFHSSDKVYIDGQNVLLVGEESAGDPYLKGDMPSIMQEKVD